MVRGSGSPGILHGNLRCRKRSPRQTGEPGRLEEEQPCERIPADPSGYRVEVLGKFVGGYQDDVRGEAAEADRAVKQKSHSISGPLHLKGGWR